MATVWEQRRRRRIVGVTTARRSGMRHLLAELHAAAGPLIQLAPDALDLAARCSAQDCAGSLPQRHAAHRRGDGGGRGRRGQLELSLHRAVRKDSAIQRGAP